jgi:tRNA A58 N-methylase Trm61
MSVDATGAPLPWITYPAIEFLRKRITPEMSVFEYGSGGSTTWWAGQVSEVVSVEHDRTWFDKMEKHSRSNVKAYQIDLVYGGAYSKKILEFENRFDVVVIDGRDRVNCLKNCLRALKPSGVIILDNSDRPEYSEGVSFLRGNRFKRIEFVGFAPIVNYKTETAIFYRDGNAFGI